MEEAWRKRGHPLLFPFAFSGVRNRAESWGGSVDTHLHLLTFPRGTGETWTPIFFSLATVSALSAKVLKHRSKTSLSPAEMLSLLINNCNQQARELQGSGEGDYRL